MLNRPLLLAAAVVAAAACTSIFLSTPAVEATLFADPLDFFYQNDTGRTFTTLQGVPVSDDENQLKAGIEGPTLLEDFIYREKITHFDHERIPERVVHARGSAAHGYFEVFDDSMAKYTKAKFLNTPGKRTPVYARFSTVQGSRGSADTARDVRGFAVKFYTEDGNFDLVSNNIPVFFIQDAIKFPDVIHAVKPEPRNEIPQASSAHNTFYDFISLETETAHMLMWIMSDRALPRSFSMMQGFGVHTFRLINAQGQSHYVKFHYRPILGVNSLVFDEAQRIAGKDPDFHRRQLWNDIENGDYPTWEFGVQLFTDADADQFDFDILDATKIIPEELIPVRIIGRLVLNRNPDNFFAETEQVAFCTGHLIPGIDITNDPLLQGRMFSYLDTQLTRLGGPNFMEIPINRPKKPFQNNNQRDGFHRMTINVDETSYGPNSINHNWPRVLAPEEGGFASYPERTDGVKRRARSPSFSDHFSQATLFWNSLTKVERQHIVEALTFELARVNKVEIRKRTISRILANIDANLAAMVAKNLGLHISAPSTSSSSSSASYSSSSLDDVSGDGGSHYYGVSSENKRKVTISPAVSQLNPLNRPQVSDLRTRRIALLAADGVDAAQVNEVNRTLTALSAKVEVISLHLGYLTSSTTSDAGGDYKADEADSVKVDHLFMTMPSVLFDAVIVVDGQGSVAKLLKSGEAVHFVAEAYKHAKPIAAIGDGVKVLDAAGILPKNDSPSDAANEGVAVGNAAGRVLEDFANAIRKHRAYNRKNLDWVNA